MGEAILIPMREDKEMILEIAERSRKKLEMNHKITLVDSSPIPTIAYVCINEFIHSISQMQSDKEGAELDFFDIIVLGSSYVEDAEGEKEGNYTPFVRLTERTTKALVELTPIEREEIISDANATTKVIDTKNNPQEVEKIRNNIKSMLAIEHNIEVGHGYIATTIACVFLEEIINYMIEKSTTGDLADEIRFLNLFTMGLIVEDEETVPYVTPGEMMKLKIKDDKEEDELY